MRILVVLAYVGFIFRLSTWSNPPSGPPLPYLDKIVHTIEYGILGLLVAWAAAGRLRGARLLALVIGVGLLVGLADEMIQRSTPGRQSSPFDLLADVIGLSCAWMLSEARARWAGSRAEIR
jgi:VanZ family protein